MPVIYDATVKTARMTATRDAVANGTLELQSASNVVLAIFGLSADGGTVSADVWTLVFDSDTVNGLVASGSGTTATKARIKDSGGTVRISGLTVGLPDSGADLELINTSISNGQPVVIDSATFQHAPDPS
jgi:hypothetical protein